MSKKTNILCEIELSATVIQIKEPPCECAIHKETPTDIAQYRCTCPVHQEMYQFHLLSSSSSSSLSVVPFFSLGMCGRPLRELTFLQMRLKKNENWYKTNYVYRHVCTCTGIIVVIFSFSPIPFNFVFTPYLFAFCEM